MAFQGKQIPGPSRTVALAPSLGLGGFWLLHPPSRAGLFVLSGSAGGGSPPPEGTLPPLWSLHRTVEALEAVQASQNSGLQ